MNLTFKHNLNMFCTTVKTSDKNLNFVDYLKEFARTVDSEEYYTAEIELDTEKYFSGEGPKRISVKKTVMGYRPGYFGQEGLPDLKERDVF